MAKQVINVGSSANDGTGDKNRVAFQKINSNFDELYDGDGAGTLQQVTDNDNTTTNPIEVSNYIKASEFRSSADDITFTDGSGNPIFFFENTGANQANFDKALLTDNRNYSLPDASGVIALQENTIPLSGTEVDKPITGDLKYGILDSVARKITFKDPNEFDFDLTFGTDGTEFGEAKFIGFYGTNGTSFGKIGLDPAFNPIIQVGDGTNLGFITLNNFQTIFFISDNPLCAGIDGNVDYSDNYTDTCFVQKAYTDGLRGKHISKTTTQINAIASPQDGETYFNTTLGTLCFYDGSAWQKVSHTTM